MSSVSIFHLKHGSEISANTSEVGINDYGFYYCTNYRYGNKSRSRPILNTINLKDIEFVSIRCLSNQNEKTFSVNDYITILFKRPNQIPIIPESERHEEMVFYE